MKSHKSKKRGAPQSGMARDTSPPKKGAGKLITARHDMGHTFNAAGPKKGMDTDMPPRTRKADRAARNSRLKNVFI